MNQTLRKILGSAKFIKDSAVEPTVELFIMGYILFIVSSFLPWVGNIVINHTYLLIKIAFIYLAIKTYLKSRRLRSISNKIDRESEAKACGRYKELCEEKILLAEYNIDIATKNMNTYRVLSISSIVAIILSQMLNTNSSFEGLKKIFFELEESTKKIQSLQVIDIPPSYIITIVYILLISYFAFQYHQNSARYDNWRYTKLDYSSKLARYKEPQKSELLELINGKPN